MIHNMELYLVEKGSGKKLSPADMVFLERCERMIVAALRCSRGETVAADITCNVMTGEASCCSGLEIRITDIPNEISWKCPLCGSTGLIQNWRKSPVCSSVTIPKARGRSSSTLLVLPAECFPLLEEICTGNPEFMLILSMADVSDSACSFHISGIDRYRLLESVHRKSLLCHDDNYAALEEILKESIKETPGF